MLVRFITGWDQDENEINHIFKEFLNEYIFPSIRTSNLDDLYLNHHNNEVFFPANDLFNINTIISYAKINRDISIFINAQFKYEIDEELIEHPDNLEIRNIKFTFWGLFKGEKCSSFNVSNDQFNRLDIAILSDYLYYTIKGWTLNAIPSNFKPFLDINKYNVFPDHLELISHYKYFERITEIESFIFNNNILSRDQIKDFDKFWKIPINNYEKKRFEIKKFKEFRPFFTSIRSECYNKHTYTIVIDTETNGLPQNFNTSFPYENYPEIVQISWVILDKFDRILKIQDFIVKPDGYKITSASTKIHGIHDIIAKITGKGFNEVISELLEDLSICELIVGHNLEYDIKVIESMCYKYFIKDKNWLYSDKNGFFYKFKNLVTFCTMKDGTEYLENKKSEKWLSLEELYNHLFASDIKGLHNSLKDIWVTNYCFQQLKWGTKLKSKYLVNIEDDPK